MRLLVVEDEPLLAECLAEILKLNPKYESIAIAQGYQAGLETALAEGPDVAILDLHLGRDSKSGSELAAELRKVAPQIRTLILTADPSPEAAAKALQGGADGFMLKRAIFKRLDEAVETLLGGRRFVDPAIAAEALMRVSAESDSEDPRHPGLSPAGLAPAELAVLRALAQGMSNEQIAIERERSVETVKTQLQKIYGKLGVKSREEAVRVARMFGLV